MTTFYKGILQEKLHWLFICFCFLSLNVNAQALLQKPVSINLKNSKLSDALQKIAQRGSFYFSYNGNLVNKDSLITLEVIDQPVLQVLHRLFNNKFEYHEQGKYLIITPALLRLALMNTDLTTDGGTLSVSGLVVDERNGERLMNASVYEKQQLVSALTDEHGYFRLKFKTGDPASIAITASKLKYKDTTIHFLKSVMVNSRYNADSYKNNKEKGNRVERTGLGNLFISTRQMIQSLNIPDFFATRPFQVSITPGLSTHGMFSPQVVNKASLNLIGGYTAGVNGIELGGLFNINKKDSRYLQLAGVFNLVGGNAYGLQLAGVHNRALDTVRGAQISFFTNKAEQQLSGIQISALHNETRHLKGLQIGLINVADTSEGASIGIVNVVRNGFYRVQLSENDLTNTNIALKTGRHAFYSSLLIGANLFDGTKMYTFGLGIGHDFMLGKRLYLSGEVDYQFANTGSWDDRWARGKLLLSLQVNKHISLIAGPVFNHYKHSGSWSREGYKNVTGIPEYPVPSVPYQTKNWLSWEAGLAFNSVFKPAKKMLDNSASWYLGAAATGGIGWQQPFRFVSGGELFVQRDLGENLSGIISTGYTYFSVYRNQLIYRNGDTYVYSRPLRVIPVTAGVRLKTGKSFYISGEVGQAFIGKQPYFEDRSYSRVGLKPYRSFSYAATAGFSFTNGLEAGIKYDDYGLQTNDKQFALRLGYRIKLSK
jgi:hypothetical protein